jgi:tetratricopeptide (TPR) repeat protein
LMEMDRDEEALAQASVTEDVELPADWHHPDLVARIDLRGHVLLALDRDAEALAHFEAALPRLEARYPEGARALASTLVGLGRARVELGRHTDAVAPLERALAHLDETPDADLRLRGQARFALARALDALGRSEPAKASARTALAALARSTLPSADEHATVEAWLAAHE